MVESLNLKCLELFRSKYFVVEVFVVSVLLL